VFSLANAVAACVVLALTAYVLLGGADFGGGVWDLLAVGPRRRAQRALIADAIGPIWEANHVWLILVVVLLFSGFPPAFAAAMTALHIPLTAALVGVVLRGSAFVFRKYDAQDDAHHRRWSTWFGAASFFTPFLLGLSLGALASGEIRVVNGTVASGFFAGWTRPFAVGCGLFAQGLFAYLAAAYMTVATSGDPVLQRDFRTRALFSGVMLAPAALLVYLLAARGAPLIFAHRLSWWAPLVSGATSVCAVTALVALWRNHFRLARVAVAGQVALILLGWGLAQFPMLIVPDVTLANSATEPQILRLLGWLLAAGSVVLVPSLAYLFWVFRTEPRTAAPGEPAGH
jgi:cytochrome d ubiquinol oxidase subunit II